MKCRVFADGDNIHIDWVNPKHFNDDNIHECKIPAHLAHLPMKIVDSSDLPQNAPIIECYPDFAENGEPYVKRDVGFFKKLMPDYLIKEKEIAAKIEEIKAETDPLNAVKLQIELSELKEKNAGFGNDDPFWSQKALDGLSRAETEKPEIEAKLKSKLGL